MRRNNSTLCALIPHPARANKSYAHWHEVGENLANPRISKRDKPRRVIGERVVAWYTMHVTRADIHNMVDQIPEADLERTASVVRALRANDRWAIHLALAPEEAAESDEIEALEEGIRDPNYAQLTSLDDVKAELGLR